MRKVLIAVAILLTSVAGCSRDARPTAKIALPPSITVDYLDGAKAIVPIDRDDIGHITSPTFRVKGGELQVEGKSYGPVKNGDKVRIEKSGRVLINGEQRFPIHD